VNGGRRSGPQRSRVTGHYAGPLSRLLAFIIDSVIVVALFGIATGLVTYVASLLSSSRFDGLPRGGPGWILLFGTFAFLYFWACLTLAGRTAGKAVIGLRIVSRDGRPLTPRRAFVRTLVLPISIVSVVGLVGGVVGRERRALHDVAGRSVAVFDWGDRPAELPAPLTRWLADRPEAPLKLPDTPAGVPEGAPD
jgi:uncharacterized RDD family membrane protein YckC